MKTTKQTTAKLVAMISAPLADLTTGSNTHNEIRVTIARLATKETANGGRITYPANWRLDYEEPKTSTGGCFARVYASTGYKSDEVNVYAQHYGPEISYGEAKDYAHADRAMKVLGKRYAAMYAQRGNPADSAAALGEFCEAAGVDEVWIARDTGDGWLDRTDWMQVTVGAMVHMIRRHLPAEIAKHEAAEQEDRRRLAEMSAEKETVAA